MARLAARSAPSTTIEEKARSAESDWPAAERAPFAADVFIIMREFHSNRKRWQGERNDQSERCRGGREPRMDQGQGYPNSSARRTGKPGRLLHFNVSLFPTRVFSRYLPPRGRR